MCFLAFWFQKQAKRFACIIPYPQLEKLCALQRLGQKGFRRFQHMRGGGAWQIVQQIHVPEAVALPPLFMLSFPLNSLGQSRLAQIPQKGISELQG